MAAAHSSSGVSVKRRNCGVKRVLFVVERLRSEFSTPVVAGNVVTAEGATRVPALKAKVVDTTGAGDCFVGALAARLAAGATLVEAARYANVAAACSVERFGAAPSMPTSREVAARLARA